MVALKRTKTIREALQHHADHPRHLDTLTITDPAWEHIAARLYWVANHPDARVRGSMGRATRAQKMILDRMVGRRRPGTHPAQASNESIEFVDLTAGVLAEAAAAAEDEEDVQA
jgi:hypothetical protein